MSGTVQIWPPPPAASSGSGLNASVGPTNTPLPSSATLVGGSDPSNNLQALKVDNAGNLLVSPSSSSTSLVNIIQWGSTNVSLGQKVMASSLPVTIASDQSGIAASQSGVWNINNISGTVSLPTGAATAAKQPAIGTAGSPSIDVLSVQGVAGGTALPVQSTGSGTSLINISQYGGAATTLGQKVMASSIPVTIASDQIGIASSQSGVWTVQPGNTPNNTPWLMTIASTSVSATNALKVDNSAVAQPVIGSVSARASTPTAGTITQAAIAVGLSAVRATVSGSAPSAIRSVLAITPDPISTATFYLGSSSVTGSGSSRGFAIVAGQTFVANSDAGDYYIIASSATQTVFVMEQS